MLLLKIFTHSDQIWVSLLSVPCFKTILSKLPKKWKIWGRDNKEQQCPQVKHLWKKLCSVTAYKWNNFPEPVILSPCVKPLPFCTRFQGWKISIQSQASSTSHPVQRLHLPSLCCPEGDSVCITGADSHWTSGRPFKNQGCSVDCKGAFVCIKNF